MSSKLCPKIILEGTRLTFKTEIAFELNQHPEVVGKRKYRYHSPIISAEWCAFTNYPWGRGIINFEPHEENKAMETYATWIKLFELLRYYSWIIDRFHISTKMAQLKLYGKHYDFSWLEERLTAIGFRLVFLTRSPDSFETAKKERLKISGNPSQYNDISAFIKEQELLNELISKSILPKITIDISDNNIEKATNSNAASLKDYGGLYADY
jgi:hypothetical protein